MLTQEFFGHGVIELQEELILAGDFGQKILPLELHRSIELGFTEAL